MEETLTTTQIAARLAISERTAQRWIAQKKLPARLLKNGRYVVSSDDLKALEPTYTEQAIESRLIELESRIQALSARVGELEKQPATGAPVRTLRPAPVPYNSAARNETGIPSARSFAEAHSVTRWRMEGQIKAGAFTATPVVVNSAGRIVPSLNQEQQAAAIRHWDSIGLEYTRCANCPHTAKTV